MADLVISSVLQVIIESSFSFLVECGLSHLDRRQDESRLKSTLKLVEGVLEDAEEKQMTTPAVGIWLSLLKDVAHEAECLLLQLSLKKSVRNASKLKETLQALENAAKEVLRLNLREGVPVHRDWDRRETSSFVVESEVYGRKEDKKEIVKLLLSCEGGREVSCIAIIGMGGLGKTTLAQLAYNNQMVTEKFDVKVWIFVSHLFDVKKILTMVIESLTEDKCQCSNMDALHSKIPSLLNNKRYLIVLDDVWTEDPDDWDKMRPLFGGGSDGSKIMITTRSRRAAFVADLPTFPYYLKELSEDACWSLFKHRAFQRREEKKYKDLLPIGQQIVRKCGGLALAAKTLGSLMHFKRGVKEWMFVRDSELWNLDECGNGILPALRLSYSRLPLHLKRCLAFCSIFPRNYEFKKEKLIHLWMAQGLVRSRSGRKNPEDIGNDYFTDLEWISFFQKIKQYESGVVIGYKMHEVIYDLVKSVTSSEYATLNYHGFATPTNYNRIRHSSVVCDFRSSRIPKELYEAGNHVRTLLLFSEGNLEVLPKQLYSSLSCLFAMDLSGSGLMKLESSIGAMSHLRYFDLSHTHISKLPLEVEGLCSLETLNLYNCYNLLALPDFTKMRNLRHLNNDGCRKLTRMLKRKEKDLGRNILDSSFLLQTLPLFVVGGLVDRLLLQKLKLKGTLKITHLENLEAESIQPDTIQRIESLGLYWGSDDHGPSITEGESIASRFQERKETQSLGPSQGVQLDPFKGEKVLSKLKPNYNLERLLIKGYPGFSLPNWDAPNLKVIDLSNCKQIKHLPTLGNLYYLTSLSLRKMHGVRCIGKDFYGKGNKRPFPVLKELVIVDFPNLEDWLGPGTGADPFPNLRKLILNTCPKLTRMPQILSLHHLDLQDCCATLLVSFHNLRLLETLVIEGVKDLSCFLGEFPIRNSRLTTWDIKSCPLLSFLPNDLGKVAALKSLVIRWCGNLNALPQSLLYLSALESLEIGDCHSLTSIFVHREL